ncbi:MAG: CZB domain-containing protein, partial [Bryobacterales bacterium]|nr:CZB domain-containing protein [Bryobacterales bacterium]
GHEHLDAGEVEADDQCEFGQWLCNAGDAYSDRPEYRIVVEKHREFHRVAAQAVRLAGTLPPGKALSLVSLHSAVTHASTECVAALCSFRA